MLRENIIHQRLHENSTDVRRCYALLCAASQIVRLPNSHAYVW